MTDNIIGAISGASQSSKLGPILLLIYINEIDSAADKSSSSANLLIIRNLATLLNPRLTGFTSVYVIICVWDKKLGMEISVHGIKMKSAEL